MTKREFGRSKLLPYIAFALVAATVLTLGLRATAVYAQEQSAVERFYRLLMRISDQALVRLPPAVADLAQGGPEASQAFFDDPRAFLKVKGIDLPVNAYQVVALDFSIRPDDPTKAWFGVAEQQEGLTFVAPGVGLFYENVGIFIQGAIASPDASTSPVMISSPMGGQAIESYLQLIERIPAEALVRLPSVIEELNAAPADDPRRAEFLANPREYLLKRDILLPGAYYRVVAIDFQRAAQLDMPVIHTSRTRGGLAVVPEGIGLFVEGAGIFIQEAI